MSTPDSDNPKVDSDRTFDFLDEDSVGRAVRAKQARQSAEFVMPIIRKPVPVSESGPAQVSTSSFAVGGSTTPDASEASELPGDDFAGDDFEFLDTTSAQRPLPVAPPRQAASISRGEAWNEGIHVVDNEQGRSSVTSKWVGLLVGIVLISGGSIAYMLFGGATTTGSDTASVTAGSDTANVTAVAEPSDQASNGASLYQRFTQHLETLQSLVASGQLDDADELLSTMDKTVYGYGAAEFSQIESEIDQLRSGTVEAETVAEATESAEAARVEQAEQLAEAARVEAAQVEAARVEAARVEAARVEAARVEAARAEAAKLEVTRQAEVARELELARLAEQERLAEEARVAEVARQEEAARLAEQTRLEQQAEAARLAELAAQAEEQRLAEVQRQAEEARLAELARQAEEKRIADAARQAEAEALRLAEVARQAEEARLAEVARQAEEARLAEATRQAEVVRVAEAAKAEETRLAQVAQQAEAARQESVRAAAIARQAQAVRAAEQARVAEEARLVAERERVAAAGREAARAARALVAAERASASLDQETLALGTDIAQEQIDSARAQEINQQRRLAERARLSRESAEAAEFERQQAAQRQLALDAQANLEVTPIRSSSGISDEDFNYVANQFVQLKNAITERNIEKVASLTRTSGSRTQQLLQVFQNHSEIKARISSVNAVDSDGRIVGKLLIQKLVRNSGVEVSVPSNLSSIELTSTRGPSGWSDIIW